MSDEPMPLFTEPLSDEAAYTMADWLNRLSIEFENAYCSQIWRHLATMDEYQNTNNDQPWRSTST